MSIHKQYAVSLVDDMREDRNEQIVAHLFCRRVTPRISRGALVRSAVG
jgi:hypothetical protein